METSNITASSSKDTRQILFSAFHNLKFSTQLFHIIFPVSNIRQLFVESGHHDYLAGRFLPDEVLGHIFAFLKLGDLSSCARVCHSWSKLVWYWQIDLNLQVARDFVDDKLIRWIYSRCKQIRSLDLTRCFLITDASISLISTIPSLTSINLDYCNRITDGTPRFSDTVQNELISWSVQNIKKVHDNLCNGLMMLASMNQMRKFSLSCSTKISSAGIQPFTRLPMTSLCLSGCRALDSGVFLVLAAMPTLEHLDLSDFPQLGASASIDGLIELGGSLRSLNLSRCALRDAHLPILATLSRLEDLDLSENEALTVVGIESLAGLTMMKRLNLSNCHKITDAGLLHIGHLTGLLELNLSRCASIQDGGMVFLQHLKQLKTLNLTGCQVGNDALVALSNLPSLETLILWNCSVNDEGLNNLVWFQQLKHLDLSNCNAITNFGVSRIAKLPRLTSLNLSGLIHINEFGIKHLITMAHLQRLRLSWCSSISDSAMSYALLIPSLTDMDISSCRGITDASIPLLESGIHVRQLDISNCIGMSGRQQLARMRASKGLQTLF